MAATYRAATTAKTAVANGTAPFFAIYGSSTKNIHIERITVSTTVATAAAYVDLIVTKRTAALSGGTKTDLTQVPLDSSESAGSASICGLYTAAPTAGTGGGAIGSRMVFAPITGTPALTPPPVEFLFGGDMPTIEVPLLRGTGQGLELSFGTAPGNAPTVTVSVVWTEEVIY